jgi:hypothetical protein
MPELSISKLTKAVVQEMDRHGYPDPVTAHQVRGVLYALGAVTETQLKEGNKIVIPNVCMLKTVVKPATSHGTKQMFGKVVQVNAKPQKTIVKALPAAVLKKGFS